MVMQSKKVLIVLLAALTIVFAIWAISAYLYIYTHTSGQPTQTTITTQIPQALPDRGYIRIYDGATVKVFEYMKWNSSTPNTFTFDNVTFTLWTNTTVTNTAGSCYGAAGGYGGYLMTFQDGSSESFGACTTGPNPPIDVTLTKHVNPQAGLLIIPTTGAVYFLVSV